VETTSRSTPVTAGGGNAAAGGHGRGTARKRSEGTGRPRLRRAIARHWYAWAMVAPVALVIGLIIGYPLVRGAFLSLTDADEANVERTIGVNHIPATYKFTGLDNYTAILSDSVFWDRLGWTVVWTVGCVSFTFVLGLTLAVMLNRRFRGRSFYRIAMIVPWGIPAFVSVFAWKMLFNEKSGLLNKVLDGGGIEGVPWLGDPVWAMPSLAITTLWWTLGFNFVLYLAGLQEIPRDLYEASAMDGASPWQQIRRITIPMLGRTTTLVAVLQVIASLKVFDQMYIMTSGGPNFATRSILQYVYDEGFTNYRVGYAAAVSMLFFLVVLAVSAVWFTLVRRQEREV